jgi:hypothetical protein
MVAHGRLRVMQMLRGLGDRAVRGDRREDAKTHDIEHVLILPMGCHRIWH